MKLVGIIAVIQVLFIAVILSLPLQSKTSLAIRHVGKYVLGTAIIADDTSSTNTPTDTPTPDTTTDTSQTGTQDQPIPTSTDNSSPANYGNQPTDTPMPVDQSQSTSDNSTTPTTSQTQQPSDTTQSNPALPDQNISPSNQTTTTTQTITPDTTDQSLLQNTTNTQIQEITPTGAQAEEATLTPLPTGIGGTVTPSTIQDQTNSDNGDTSNGEPTTQVTASPDNATSADTSGNSTDAIIIDPQSVIANTSSINDAVVNNVTNQTVMVNNATSPEQKVSDLQTFVKDNVIDLNHQITQNSFSSTALISQQLNNQIDSLSNNLTTLPSQSQKQISMNVKQLCQQADIALRTEAMQVPEDLEQDLIIDEAKCYNLSQ